jgi:hypothetical protein
MMKGLVVLIAVIVVLASDQARAEPQTRFYDSQGRSIGTATPYGNGSVRYYDARGKTLARPRRLAIRPGSTTLVDGPLAPRPPLAHWRSREGSASRGGIPVT